MTHLLGEIIVEIFAALVDYIGKKTIGWVATNYVLLAVSVSLFILYAIFEYHILLGWGVATGIILLLILQYRLYSSRRYPKKPKRHSKKKR